MEQVIQHVERFDPADENMGRLIGSEHRARYWWAADIVSGKDVLDAGCGVGYGAQILARAGAKSVIGVDIDPRAVEQAKKNADSHGDTMVEGDLCNLPFEDGCFDLVVCFEVIEHLKDADKALAEFRRVLRREGMLIVSTPNPDVYVGGNEHHYREFRPHELFGAVSERFTNAVSYRQQSYLASIVEPTSDDTAAAADEPASTKLLRTASRETGAETYGIVLAGNGELPSLGSIVALGETFEVKWWLEQVTNHAREATHAAEREGAATIRLQETSAALVKANQELAQIPLLQHQIAVLQEAHSEFLSSRSWRLTAPLRWRGLRRFLRRH